MLSQQITSSHVFCYVLCLLMPRTNKNIRYVNIGLVQSNKIKIKIFIMVHIFFNFFFNLGTDKIPTIG